MSGASSHADFLGRRWFGALDALRASAISAVIVHHVVGSPRLGPVEVRGFLGVDVFFVLSGFLISTLLVREREATGTIALGAFWARRARRIFPAYYALLLLMALGLGLRPGSSNAAAFFGGLPYYATYTSNWVEVPKNPDGSESWMHLAWSLATEEQFYLAWPLVERLGARPRTLTLGALVAVNLAVAVAWTGPRPDILQVTYLPLLVGVALAHTLHRPGGFAWVTRWAGPRAAAPALAVVALAVACARPGPVTGWPRAAFALAAAALLAALVVREDHGLSALTRLAPLRRLGTVSYGMYLYHQVARYPVMRAFAVAGVAAPILQLPLVVALTWALAELSFRTVERWFDPRARARARARVSRGDADTGP